MTIGLVLAGTPLLLRLPFDFNPINLQNPNSPAVITYRQLQKYAETSASDAELLAPSVEQADAAASRLAALPQVSRTITISSYVPSDQDTKIAELKSASARLGRALGSKTQPPPTDEETVASIKAAANSLSAAADNQTGAGADAARNVAAQLSRLANADPAVRQKAENAFVSPLRYDLGQLRQSLSPRPISIATLPPDLVRDWVLPDGRARVEVLPKGDLDDTAVLKRFAAAVLLAEPSASGPAISYYRVRKDRYRSIHRSRHPRPCRDFHSALLGSSSRGGRTAHPCTLAARRRGDARDLRS